MVTTYIGLHGSNKSFETFDLTKFSLTSLTGDTRQFGVYCYFGENQLLFNSAKKYALKFSNIGYVYKLKITVDTCKLINPNTKISIQKYIDLYKIFGFTREKLIDMYSEETNNIDIFYKLCYSLLSKKGSLFCSKYLVDSGYHGFMDGKNFGTLVLFDTSILQIIDKIKVP